MNNNNDLRFKSKQKIECIVSKINFTKICGLKMLSFVIEDENGRNEIVFSFFSWE